MVELHSGQDLREPEGMTFTVEPGWASLNEGQAPTLSETPLVRIRQVDVPAAFTMHVRFDAADQSEWQWVSVFFWVDRDTGNIEATAAWSGGLDVDEAMRSLTTARPMSWWKTKCIVTFALELFQLDATDDPTRVAQSDLPETSPEASNLQALLKERVAAASNIPTSRRRNRITDNDLKRVAEVYSAALAAGDPPTMAVQREFYKGYSTAARYVSLARDAGFLAPVGQAEKEAPHG